MDINNLNNERNKLIIQLRSGATWFYWIAGISVVNMIVSLFNGKFIFVIGLGITQIIEPFLIGLTNNNAPKFINIIMTIIFSGIFAIFGYFSLKRKSWSFITGAVLYFLDGFIFLIAKDYLSFAFHLFALFFIVRGFLAIKKITTAESQIEQENLNNNSDNIITVSENENRDL